MILKLSLSRLPLRLSFCALLIACCLVLPSLLAVSSGAARRRVQQTTATATANAPPASTVASSSLKFPVTVTSAKGGFIIGLTKENFSVWEGKQEREINYFSSGDLPASVGILIDVSGSVNVHTLEAVKYAAERFIRNGHPKNEYIIGEFNDAWRGSSGWQQEASAIEALNRRPATDESQAKKKTRGQTALYDACDAALDDVAARPNPRHVLLLFTDGEDNLSRVSLGELRRKIKASDMLIYAVCVYEPDNSGFLNAEGQVTLEELTTTSGGRVFFPHNQKDKKELNEVIDVLSLEMRYQYVVGFTPTNAAPAGKWNKVKIKLTPPNEAVKKLYLRTREGYFSPTATP
jgi:Ca-activated chloride channel family protein